VYWPATQWLAVRAAHVDALGDGGGHAGALDHHVGAHAAQRLVPHPRHPVLNLPRLEDADVDLPRPEVAGLAQALRRTAHHDDLARARELGV
jgi:hypothetical protein